VRGLPSGQRRWIQGPVPQGFARSTRASRTALIDFLVITSPMGDWIVLMLPLR
jgi:hypothetical protein